MSKQPLGFSFQRQQQWSLAILAINPRRALLDQFRIHLYSADIPGPRCAFSGRYPVLPAPL
jgi:hypothetical protein